MTSVEDSAFFVYTGERSLLFVLRDPDVCFDGMPELCGTLDLATVRLAGRFHDGRDVHVLPMKCKARGNRVACAVPDLILMNRPSPALRLMALRVEGQAKVKLSAPGCSDPAACRLREDGAVADTFPLRALEKYGLFPEQRCPSHTGGSAIGCREDGGKLILGVSTDELHAADCGASCRSFFCNRRAGPSDARAVVSVNYVEISFTKGELEGKGMLADVEFRVTGSESCAYHGEHVLPASFTIKRPTISNKTREHLTMIQREFWSRLISDKSGGVSGTFCDGDPS